MLSDLLDSLPSSIFVTIVDNSPTPVLQTIVQGSTMIAYHYAGSNLGYGKGHNLGLKLSPSSNFHLIVNPDIVVHPGAIEQMISYMEKQTDIGILTPLFLFDDGSIQYLNRRYPTVLDLLLRHIPVGLLPRFIKDRIHHHEMRDVGYAEACDVQCMSGAFMLCRREALERIGGFDPRYFMYFEDFDLCCAIRQQGLRTVSYPVVSVIHRWCRSSSKEICMTLTHIQSMILFFNKWGWKWW